MMARPRCGLSCAAQEHHRDHYVQIGGDGVLMPNAASWMLLFQTNAMLMRMLSRTREQPIHMGVSVSFRL